MEHWPMRVCMSLMWPGGAGMRMSWQMTVDRSVNWIVGAGICMTGPAGVGRRMSWSIRESTRIQSRESSPITNQPFQEAKFLSRAAMNGGGVPTVHHPAYSAPILPPGHRFPMKIFSAIYEQLLQTGIVRPHQVQIPALLPTKEQLHLVHDAAYVDSFCMGTLEAQAVRRIGLPWSEILVERTLSEVAGTLLTAELALRHGLACNTAGGTHHAFRDFGSGFCIINDLAVTSMVLLEQGAVERVLIVDLDVHQGDGTASIFQNEPRVFTMSMHCGANFPARKQRSDLDIDVPAGTGDEGYLRILAEHLPEVLRSFRPDLVLYDAGVDPHKDDTLGRLCLTDKGLYRREMQVLDACLGFGVPVAGNVGGGYSTNLQVLAERHCLLHRAAAELSAQHNL